MKQAVLLFAHGSRDPRWRLPVERLRRTLARRLGGAVATAYLEFSRPDLESQVAAFVDQGFKRVRIVPVFLGAGRHLKRDLARKATALRRKHSMRISVGRAIGEQSAVIAAIAGAIEKGVRTS